MKFLCKILISIMAFIAMIMQSSKTLSVASAVWHVAPSCWTQNEQIKVPVWTWYNLPFLVTFFCFIFIFYFYTYIDMYICIYIYIFFFIFVIKKISRNPGIFPWIIPKYQDYEIPNVGIFKTQSHLASLVGANDKELNLSFRLQ